MALETKLCPFCAEEIKSAAIYCKHCHQDLGSSIQDGEGSDDECWNCQAAQLASNETCTECGLWLDAERYIAENKIRSKINYVYAVALTTVLFAVGTFIFFSQQDQTDNPVITKQTAAQVTPKPVELTITNIESTGWCWDRACTLTMDLENQSDSSQKVYGAYCAVIGGVAYASTSRLANYEIKPGYYQPAYASWNGVFDQAGGIEEVFIGDCTNREASPVRSSTVDVTVGKW